MSVCNQQATNFMVLSSNLSRNTKAACLSLMSVSKMYYVLLLGSVCTGGEMSFSLNVSEASSSASIRDPRSFLMTY